MDIQPALRDEAAREGTITEAQGEAPWRFLHARAADRPALRATHGRYHVGGLVAYRDCHTRIDGRRTFMELATLAAARHG
jgi:hypothetical protein